MQYDQRPRPVGAKALFIWSLSALAFGYAFFQRVAPSVMVSDLMAEFTIGGAVTGYLSALYFYPYVLLQFPLGALLDRFGVRVLLALALGLAAAGSYLFGSALTIEQAYIGRFLIGTGSAVGFLGSLTLAANWFPVRRFALLAGLVMFFGMVCGIGGQAPLAALIAKIGWRNAMFAAAAFAAGLGLLVALFVRNAPAGHEQSAHHQTQSWGAIWSALKQALSRREIWMIAVVSTTMAGPLLAFAGLWGVPYIMAEYRLQPPEAAFYVSMMLLGWAVGAPASGWLSDRIMRRKLPIVCAAFIQATLMGAIAFIPAIPLTIMAGLMFAAGVMGAAVVINFALAREVSEPAIHGSVSGIVNAMTVAAGAILQPIIGTLLDWQWDGSIAAGARVYSPDQFRTAFICLFAWTLAGAFLTLKLRETYCRSAHDSKT